MKIENNKLVFDSGRTFDRHSTIVGLAVGDALEYETREVFSGYDSTFDTLSDPNDETFGTRELSDAECVELADFMVAQWAAFRERHANPANAADIVRGAGALSVSDFGALGGLATLTAGQIIARDIAKTVSAAVDEFADKHCITGDGSKNAT